MSWSWQTRPVAERDRDWAFALHKESLGAYIRQTWGWDEMVQRAMFDEKFDNRPRQVISLGDLPIGALELEQRPEELYLALIELVADWRGRGIGAEIVRSLVAQARGSGRPLGLHVLRADPRAVAFYERLGLVTVEVEELKFRLQSE